uniref:PlsC domain-containing protein n=1 Tax=Syphacia muris TaxID=451379 RepID=A0A0N5AYA5_9BILA
MIPAGVMETGIDAPTMHAEDSENINNPKTTKEQMDLKKVFAIIVAFYWVVMTVIIVPTAVVASFITVMVPALLISTALHNWIDHKLCRMVNDHWVAAMQSTGLNIIEYGDDISKISEKRVLLLSNHLGLVDHFIIMSSTYNKGTIAEKYLWVIFNIWKMTPLGFMWLTHGNFFINGGASKRAGVLETFRKHLINNYWKYDHKWIVMYPEGSRLFLIRDSNAKYAAKLGLEPLKHCALPRTGAAKVILDVAGKKQGAIESDNQLLPSGNYPPIEYIVDSTIGYSKGKVPNLGNLMCGDLPSNDFFVAIHHKIYPVKAEWSNEEMLRKWLYERYYEKDKLLDNFYKTDTFPSRPRPVNFPFSRTAIVETFWTLLFYAHYALWIKPCLLYLFHLMTSSVYQLVF